MNKYTQTITDDELHAYVDGQLPPERRAAVQAHLAVNDEAARRVADYQRYNQQLQQLFDPLLQQPVPARFTRRGFMNVDFKRYAAVLVLMIFSASGGWLMHGHALTRVAHYDSLADAAALAHAVYTPEIVHPVEVTAAQEDHLIKWVSKRMGESIQAPKLTSMGYGLVGGRLLPDESGPAAQFMYEDKNGNRLTLYVKRNNKTEVRETAFRYVEENHVKVFYWIDGSLGYALSGDIEKQKMLKIANAAYAWIEDINR